MILHTTFAFGQNERTYEGITEPVADATLSVPVTGIIAKQIYREGDAVPKGEVILELDKRREEMEVLRQTTLHESLKKDLERTRKLFDTTKAVSQEELDQKTAAVKVAEADLAIAQVDLGRRQLVAPFSGVLADLFGKEEGEGVELQAPLARLVDTSRCVFVCNLPDSAVVAVKKGDAVEVLIGEGEPIRGTVVFISPVIDPSSSLVEVKAVFENRQNRVRPGASGQIHFVK